MISKKIFRLSLVMALVVLAAGVCWAASFSLPEIDGWKCGEIMSADFDAVSGNQGYWLQRDYTTPSGTPIEAILMGGKGPGNLRMPPPGTDSATGVYGDGGTFRTLRAGGFPAILENRPLLGLSLSVNLGGATVTFESARFALSEDEFIEAASVIIRSMNP
ncbi:MAG: hypothetical protein LBO21_00665 [Synergistaceae bacterium]|nr:hypothetical protein [Synergistaceae bacterium]